MLPRWSKGTARYYKQTRQSKTSLFKLIVFNVHSNTKKRRSTQSITVIMLKTSASILIQKRQHKWAFKNPTETLWKFVSLAIFSGQQVTTYIPVVSWRVYVVCESPRPRRKDCQSWPDSSVTWLPHLCFPCQGGFFLAARPHLRHTAGWHGVDRPLLDTSGNRFMTHYQCNSFSGDLH